MNQTKQSGSRVVPFTGEFYQPEPPPVQPQRNSLSAVVLLGICLLATGAALGATATYNSPDQVQMRTLQTQSEQLAKIKEQICK
ncbi:hypothetical protein BV372_08120 [Nostoc sp. T09]|uniref:hypothetical protein n=1 Tax=Nostoc sp. T09 TaxID=1932621 RepID=UPI000A3B30C6|nr:hypothetical protein [Nostoc sp. T09]OUL36373.1 hypothetical protein BV372_08120 [Nostoc sp. T09]